MWIWTVFESIRCMIKLYALKFIITQIDCDIDRRIDHSKRTMSQHQQHQQNEEEVSFYFREMTIRVPFFQFM